MDYAGLQGAKTLKGTTFSEIINMRITEQQILSIMNVPPEYAPSDIIGALNRGSKYITSHSANNGGNILLNLYVEESDLCIATPTRVYREPIRNRKA